MTTLVRMLLPVPAALQPRRRIRARLLLEESRPAGIIDTARMLTRYVLVLCP